MIVRSDHLYVKILVPVFMILFLTAVGFAADGHLLFGVESENASESHAPRLKAGEILVKFKSDVGDDTLVQVLGDNQAAHLRTLRRTRTQIWKVPEGQETDAAMQLNNRSDVLFAEPNYIYRIFATPGDPFFSEQWAHQSNIGSLSAWDVSVGSSDVIIAIVDSGIDVSHPDLKAKIVESHDFVKNDDIPDDEHGHGTHVSGIAAASTNNGKGIAGMDWRAGIMSVKVMDYDGYSSASDLSEGITWAYEHGAMVINLSLGGAEYSQTLQEAINAAHAEGCLVVAAMGNNRTLNPTNYPAACENVMAVAATTYNDTCASYSQYGSHCDIAAPGGQMTSSHDPYGIYSTMPTQEGTCLTGGKYNYYNGYDYMQGTSMAAPFVSGLAALIWAMKPAWTPDQVQSAIEDTADDLGPVGWDKDFGNGRINADAALAAIADDCFGDSDGDDDDVDGIDLAIWANARAITLTDTNMAAFCAVFGGQECP